MNLAFTLLALLPSHEVEGNVDLQDEIYLAIAGIDEESQCTERTLPKVERELTEFLDRAGYQLATFTATCTKGQFELHLDEGRLDRIILPHESGLRALAAQLMLDLPNKIFNRPRLEAALDRLRDEYGMDVDGYRVVRTSSVVHAGPQLTDLGPLNGIANIPEQGRYQLEIDLAERPHSTGFRISLGFRSPDGLMAGFKYGVSDLLWDDSQWEISPKVGLRVQDLLTGSDGRRFLSIAELSTRWTSPAFADGWIRMVVEPRGRMINRQRLDLGIVSYDALFLDPALLMLCDRFGVMDLELGGGVEHRRLLGVKTEDGNADPYRLEPMLRPFILGRLNFEIGTDLRAALRHTIEVSASALLAKGNNLVETRLGYAKSFAFGWHQLDFDVEGDGVFGDVTYLDEISIGSHLIGVFSDRHFTDLAGSLHTEFQFSLSRDLFRVSVFDDVVVYRQPDNKVAVANAVGLGFHALLMDTFQASIHGAFGFNSNRENDTGVTLALRQVY